jgi:hypothetical protein
MATDRRGVAYDAIIDGLSRTGRLITAAASSRQAEAKLNRRGRARDGTLGLPKRHDSS